MIHTAIYRRGIRYNCYSYRTQRISLLNFLLPRGYAGKRVIYVHSNLAPITIDRRGREAFFVINEEGCFIFGSPH